MRDTSSRGLRQSRMENAMTTHTDLIARLCSSLALTAASLLVAGCGDKRYPGVAAVPIGPPAPA